MNQAKKVSKDSIPVVVRDMIQTNSSCVHAVVSLSTDGQVGEAGHVHGQQEVGEGVRFWAKV